MKFVIIQNPSSDGYINYHGRYRERGKGNFEMKVKVKIGPR